MGGDSAIQGRPAEPPALIYCIKTQKQPEAVAFADT